MSPLVKTARLLAFTMILALLLSGCSSAPGSTPSSSSPPPSAYPAATTAGSGSETASPSPAPMQAKKVVLFTAEADLDGDGALEHVEEGRDSGDV